MNQIDLWKVFVEAQDFILNTMPPFYLKKDSIIEGEWTTHKAEVDLSRYIDEANGFIDQVFPRLDTSLINYETGIITKPKDIKFNEKAYKSIHEIAQRNHLHLYPSPAIIFHAKAEFTEIDIWNKIVSSIREEPLKRERGLTFLTSEEINKINTEPLPISIEGTIGAVLSTIRPSDEYQNSVRELLLKHLSVFENTLVSEFIPVAYVYNEWIGKAELEKITANTRAACDSLMLAIKIEDNDYLFDGAMADWRRQLGIYWHDEESGNNVICKLPKPKEGYFSIYLNPEEVSREYIKALSIQLETKFGSIFGKENIKIQYRYTFKLDSNKWKEDLSSKLNERNIVFNPDADIISFDFNSEDELKEQWDFLKGLNELLWTYNYKTHLFKVHYTYINPLDHFQAELKGHFPDLNIYYTQKKDKLTCSIHYKSGDIHTRTLAKEKLQKSVIPFFENINYDVDFQEKSEDLEEYPFEFRQNEIEAELEHLLLKLRNQSFGTKEDKKFSNLGEIVKVKFPKIHIKAESFNLKTIAREPLYGNLKGDQDRLKRLKATTLKIYSHKKNDCANPKIKKIIRDSSAAEGINDLDKLQEYIDLKKEVQNTLLGKRVNDKQLEAITKSLFAEDIFILQGPPGTGKSTSISEMVWQHLRRNKKYSVLITSETNLAVDNALDKLRSPFHNLIKPIRFGSADKLDKEGKRFSFKTIEAWVQGNPPKIKSLFSNDEPEEEITDNILEDWMKRISRQSGKYACKEENQEHINEWRNLLSEDKSLRNIFYNQYRKDVNVIGATCSTIGERSSIGKPTRFFADYCKVFYPKVDPSKCRKGIKFDLTIQDEASKASPPEMAIPMVFSKKNIIIGDHRQLPPMVDSNEFIDDIKAVAEKSKDYSKIREAKRITRIINNNRDVFDESHFEKLYRDIAPSLKTSLDTQFRMHASINGVIEQFYKKDNGLKCGLDYEASNSPDVKNPQSRYHGIDIPGFINPQHRIVWINTKSPEIKEKTSRYNMGEVEIIEKIIKLFNKNDGFNAFQSNWEEIEEQQLGIISFYGSQLRRINELEGKYPSVPMRISTVDRFQGMERNIILVSTVRSNKIANYEGQNIADCLNQKSLGFADSPNRLNVALSRAKRLLIVVGNSEHFMADYHGEKAKIYKNVINVIKNPNNPHSLFINAEKLEEL